MTQSLWVPEKVPVGGKGLYWIGPHESDIWKYFKCQLSFSACQCTDTTWLKLIENMQEHNASILMWELPTIKLATTGGSIEHNVQSSWWSKGSRVDSFLVSRRNAFVFSTFFLSYYHNIATKSSSTEFFQGWIDQLKFKVSSKDDLVT